MPGENESIDAARVLIPELGYADVGTAAECFAGRADSANAFTLPNTASSLSLTALRWSSSKRRQCTLEDIGGHVWTFSQSIADVDAVDRGGEMMRQP